VRPCPARGEGRLLRLRSDFHATVLGRTVCTMRKGMTSIGFTYQVQCTARSARCGGQLPRQCARGSRLTGDSVSRKNRTWQSLALVSCRLCLFPPTPFSLPTSLVFFRVFSCPLSRPPSSHPFELLSYTTPYKRFQQRPPSKSTPFRKRRFLKLRKTQN
jgi:hypothetical protein